MGAYESFLHSLPQPHVLWRAEVFQVVGLLRTKNKEEIAALLLFWDKSRADRVTVFGSASSLQLGSMWLVESLNSTALKQHYGFVSLSSCLHL